MKLVAYERRNKSTMHWRNESKIHRIELGLILNRPGLVYAICCMQNLLAKYVPDVKASARAETLLRNPVMTMIQLDR